jgi:hypothetical protein
MTIRLRRFRNALAPSVEASGELVSLSDRPLHCSPPKTDEMLVCRLSCLGPNRLLGRVSTDCYKLDRLERLCCFCSFYRAVDYECKWVVTVGMQLPPL